MHKLLPFFNYFTHLFILIKKYLLIIYRNFKTNHNLTPLRPSIKYIKVGAAAPSL